jgi:hypothetical protein
MMNILELPGVQTMVGNMIKTAAPELTAKVEEIQNLIVAFKQQLDRIEAQQIEIRKLLGELHHGPGIEGIEGIDGSDRAANNGAGTENAGN